MDLIGGGAYNSVTRLHVYEEVSNKDGCQEYSLALQDLNLIWDCGWINALIHVPICAFILGKSGKLFL